MSSTDPRLAPGDVIVNVEEHEAVWRDRLGEHRRLVGEVQALLEQSRALLAGTREAARLCVTAACRRNHLFLLEALAATTRRTAAAPGPSRPTTTKPVAPVPDRMRRRA
jgi:hypothetical protein